MLVEQQDVFYYVTLMNENYAQPDLPEGVNEQLLKGCYRLSAAPAHLDAHAPRVTLMGAGAILGEVIKAAAMLAEQGIAAEVFSVTSWSELARDGQRCEQDAIDGLGAAIPFVQAQLQGGSGPIIAASDYVRAVPESLRAQLPAGRRYLTLGTDGFGRSDTRQELRAYFRVDAAYIVKTALYALGQ